VNTVAIYVLLIFILLLFLIIAIRISFILARRAICTVLTTFRDYNAVNFQKALPLDLMGLGPRPFLSSRLLRDYRPWALQTLVQSGIIRMAYEGTYYLSEETLESNPQLQTTCRVK